MKKLLFILAFIFMLSSCNGEQPDNHELDEENNYITQLISLEPIIDKFQGELFGDTNITVDGYYTGFEKLNIYGGTNIIYCNDNGAVIWLDYDKEAVYRLNRQEQKEKICPIEQCRNAFENNCGHIPVYELMYSDGFLYFPFTGDEKNVSVLKYDIDKREYEKLIEFQDVHFCTLALNGRYLYTQTYNDEPHISDVIRPDNRVDFTITRIDLFAETAVVVYSDLKNPEDFEKIGELRDWRFIDNKIIMPKLNEEKILNKDTKGWIILRTSSSINITTLDMRNFEMLIDMESEKIMSAFGGDIKLYDGEIYFSTSENGLSRVNMETGKREIINENIHSFSIEDNFLYYLIDSTVYQIKLDYTRELDFNNAVAIYTPEKDYYINSWKVHNEYIYAQLASGDNGGYYRIKINSQQEPYFLY